MDYLYQEDRDFFEAIADSLFTFEDFSRLPDDTIRLWLDKFGLEAIPLIIGDCSELLSNKLYRVMDSKELNYVKEKAGSLSQEDVHQKLRIMKEAVALLKEMESSGEIIIERF